MTTDRRVLLACALAGACGACSGAPRQLEARTPPPRELPPVEMPATPPPEGHGRVVFDTTDGRMRVTAQYDPRFAPPGHVAPSSRTGELCDTPCVADLPLGTYRLFLSGQVGDGIRGDSDDLEVKEGVTVYRRAPGKYTTPTFGEAILPGIVLAVGLTAAAVGAAVMAQRDADGSAMVAGGTTFGLGVLISVGSGIWLYNATRAEQQEGSTTVWQHAR
jgi:hypothetical protein